MATILIADDRSVNRELLVTLLHHAGHEALEAADGVEALEHALRRRPDAMIVDVAMPRLDGVSLARAVRALPGLSEVPVIFCTGSSGEQDAVIAGSIERAAVLVKPNEPEAILGELAKMLGASPAPPSPQIDALNVRLSALENLALHEAQSVDFQRSSRIMEAVFELAPVAIVVVSRDGLVRVWNRAAEAVFGWPASEIIGKDPPYAWGEDTEAAVLRQRAFSGEVITSFETKRMRRDGTTIDVTIAAAPLRDSVSGVTGVILMYSDISRLKAIEAEQRRRARELEALSARLVAAQEEERTRVAREVHDELGQLLTAAKMEISGNGVSEAAIDLIDRTIDGVRRIARNLRPAVLDQFGLVAAVENEVALFQMHTGIECELSIRPASITLDRDRSTTVFRIIQEAMTNVARHAKATRMEVRLRESASDVLLEIRDDGIGIDPAAIRSNASLGLIGIRERVRLAGGTVAIEGVAGRGTIFTVRIPRGSE